MQTLMVAVVSLFVLSIALAAYAFVGYPLLTFVLAAIARRRVAKAPIEPTVTFIISAYNEERVIADKIAETLQLDYPRDKLEIIVASDGSTDRTDEIVRSFADQGVRLVRTEGRLGKTATLNAAVAASTGEIIVCSDATSRYNRGAIRELVANFADPQVGGVCGRVLYEYGNSMLARGFKLYQAFVVRQRMNESRFGQQTQLSGAIHAIRREDYVPCPPEISTEEWNALHIALHGRRSVYEPDATALEESRHRPAAEFRSRVRMALQCFAFTWYSLRHGLRRTTLLYHFQNISGKVIRWLLPFNLAVLLVTSAILAAYSAAAMAVALVLWSAAALALLGIAFPKAGGKVPGLPLLSFFAIVMCAFAVAWFKLWFGRQAASWEPERGV